MKEYYSPAISVDYWDSVPVLVSPTGALFQLIKFATVTFGGPSHSWVTLENRRFVLHGGGTVINETVHRDLCPHPFGDQVHDLNDSQSLAKSGFHTISNAHQRGRLSR
jgi:hypothetical protein